MQTRPSTSLANAPSRKSTTSLLSVLVLSAVVVAAAIPAHSIQPKPPGKMAPTITAEEAAATHQTLHFAMVVPDGEVLPATNVGYFTAYPFTRKFLISYVVYTSACREVTAGTWYGNYAPTYGVATQGYKTGRLSNGACPGFLFKSRAIYYEWIYGTGRFRNDAFEATWRGAGFHHQWIFYLRDR